MGCFLKSSILRQGQTAHEKKTTTKKKTQTSALQCMINCTLFSNKWVRSG